MQAINAPDAPSTSGGYAQAVRVEGASELLFVSALADIVKVTTLLSDRAYAQENSAIGEEVLAGLTPALTIIIAGIYDPAWLLEIEVIAAR